MGDFANKQRGVERIMHTLKIKTEGAIAEPRDEIRIKIFCATHQMLCANNKFIFDNWMILSSEDELISGFSFTREYVGIDANMIQMHVVPKIAKNLTDHFINKYPNGVIAHLTEIIAMPDNTYELDYRHGLISMKAN
jgi:hypothetical protein